MCKRVSTCVRVYVCIKHISVFTDLYYKAYIKYTHKYSLGLLYIYIYIYIYMCVCVCVCVCVNALSLILSTI